VREAVRCDDAGAVERAAHKLRGSAANFGAAAACEAAQRLEQMGHAKDLRGAAEAQEDLALALRQLQDVLVEFGKDRAT
jgi:HPt (histidine-containing phosphotransfer) domain-containing protein